MASVSPSRFNWRRLKFGWPSLAQKSDHYAELVACLLAFLALFMWLSLLDFNPLDPSILSFSSPPQKPSNWLGSSGSELAGFLIFSFGILSYLIPIPFINLALVVLRYRKNVHSVSRLIGWCLIFISLAMFVAKLWPEFSLQSIQFAAAGWLGFQLQSQLDVAFGRLGPALIASLSLIMGMLMVTRKPLIRMGIASFKRLGQQTGSRLASGFKGKSLPKLRLKKPSSAINKKTEVEALPVEDIKNQEQSDSLMAGGAIIKARAEESLPEAPPPPARQDFRDEPSIEPLGAVAPSPESTAIKPQTPYVPPEMELFKTNPNGTQVSAAQKQEFQNTAEQLIKTLGDFAIEGEVIAIQPGPVVAVYEFQAKAGTKLSKITGLIDDIALSLKVDSIFIHPVSGKRAVGIQVPNRKREVVFLGDIIQSKAFREAKSPLTFAMGKSLSGEPVCEDLASMPHLLTAGQTGSGKSVAINSLLCSIIMKASPADVRMILVDPKILELKIYEGIPHLLMPVITEAPRASLALKWACYEMDRRYQLMELARVRHITGFNQFWEGASEAEKEDIRKISENDDIDRLPYILIVIDELADLMLTAPKDVEASIQRLAQKARASGIHLVLATQRPSVDVITGVIKANLPCRCSFKVFSRGDSRTILDCMGAERLLGKGDTLFLKPGSSRLQRMQGAFLEDEEVVRMVEAVRASGQTANYDEAAIQWIEEAYQKNGSNEKQGELLFDDQDEDPRWDEGIAIAQSQGQISASFLQRSLKIGYNRAARMVEAMEKQGLVGPADGSKPRKWLGPV